MHARRVEVGIHGFWRSYRNIDRLITDELKLDGRRVFTPYERSALHTKVGWGGRSALGCYEFMSTLLFATEVTDRIAALSTLPVLFLQTPVVGLLTVVSGWPSSPTDAYFIETNRIRYFYNAVSAMHRNDCDRQTGRNSQCNDGGLAVYKGTNTCYLAPTRRHCIGSPFLRPDAVHAIMLSAFFGASFVPVSIV